MSYLKFNADYLFTGTKMLDSNQVLITNERGVIEEIIHKHDAGEDIQYFNGLLSPGFVNCHCHLELSHMKGLIPEKSGLVDFVLKIVTERHFEDEEILKAISEAEDEMYANGIVAVGDICNNTLTLSQKSKGRLAYYNFIEVSGWLPAVSQMRFERAKNLLKEFSMLNAQYSIVPHASYSVSKNLWRKIQPYFTNKVVSVHNQETVFEDEFFSKGTGDFLRMYELMNIDNSHHKPTGLSSLQSYIDELNDAKNIILVHNTFTKQPDLDWIQSPIRWYQPVVFFCLCANANKYIENVLPPIEMLLKNNCQIVLGTDSLASNWSLNLLDEMRTIQKKLPDALMQQLLQWATINGAQALQMDNILGSFEKGKQPGVVLIDSIRDEKISSDSTARRLI
jgi:aminodeoxyfutalosine deaminase